MEKDQCTSVSDESADLNLPDEDRRENIRSALKRYRETVEQHNFSIIRLIIEAMEPKPIHSNMDESFAKKRCLRVLKGEFNRNWGGDFVSEPLYLLSEDIRSELIHEHCLNGIYHLPNDPERPKYREDWFAAIRADIEEGGVTTDYFPPADLHYLCSLVSGICGSGLPLWQHAQQMSLLDPLSGDERTEVTFPMPDDDYDWMKSYWEGWEIATAVQIGSGEHTGGSFAIFCRDEELHKQWRWRYSAISEFWCSDLYDDIEGYLDFYAHFNEQSKEDIGWQYA
ncbi:hypothetical protein K431DRAFT_285606 [Polychaeton citri CBS 116435]|uniref:Uncharacterized protein n=1 Tax=Polychaeton citri CBS 116435 TaxID=1314669 RepID=A0A9P4Q959_9PEZI|nr:hypothetical protein K431DRAFT_285606 [Polychaeton citri CBS 116435]